MKKVGILSLQGDFAAHGAAVERAGAQPVYVRERPQFEEIDGLIIPGGESTTMLKLLHYEGLFDDLARFGRRKPMFGTCAGAILMAKEVSHPSQESLGLIDIAIERNAYGRQIDSRVVEIDMEPDFQQHSFLGNPNALSNTKPSKLEAVFIRAPIIRHVNGTVKVLARYEGNAVLIEQGPHLVATFHPELTADSRVHKFFLEKL
ncbi:MAG TPA: pyridoxal 5'-phosphate synthase glutaminase subunit PdxT [Candidatus Acidoferrales bacterium]|nr:pyridoxal 5'-phosphate synthase glutaminase subunit PdxT [Candidatus Acidoferrales bacterium]